MKRSDDHLINSVRFDTDADAEATASAFADAVGVIDYQRVFGAVLKKYDGLEDVVSFERIELDLGQVNVESMDKLEETLAGLFEEALAGRIAGVLQGREHLRAGRGETASFEGFNELQDNVESVIADVAIRISVIVHYFKTGKLPWNTTQQPDIEQMLVELLEKDAALVKSNILPLLGNSAAVKRMVFGLRHETVIRLLRLFVGTSDMQMAEQMAEVFERYITSGMIRVFRQEVAFTFFKTIDKNQRGGYSFEAAFLREFRLLVDAYVDYLSTIPSEEIFISLTQDVAVNYKDTSGKLLSMIGEAMSAKGYKAASAADNDRIVASEYAAEAGAASLAELETGTKMERGAAGEIGETAKYATVKEDQVRREERSTEFIDNAGLILIASFLPQAFRKMGWVKDGKLVDEQSRNKMLLWMDHLVWGQRKVYEYSFSLNKILAGMGPEEVADISVELTEEEMKEGDDLLTAVVAHWQALKKTSVEGLRTAFLQRNGKLYDEDGGWQMHVGSKAFDVLIDSLPWSFSIVKFSWMDKPLYTQWGTKV
jgi:hypothetical protein